MLKLNNGLRVMEKLIVLKPVLKKAPMLKTLSLPLLKQQPHKVKMKICKLHNVRFFPQTVKITGNN